MLEWCLSGDIAPGGKQVLQARLLSREVEGQPAASVPATAPAVVKCQMVDMMFSSVTVEAQAAASAGPSDQPARVMRRCRVQCKQEG